MHDDQSDRTVTSTPRIEREQQRERAHEIKNASDCGTTGTVLNADAKQLAGLTHKTTD